MYLGGVFDQSNYSMGDGKRYVRHLAAKVTDDLLGRRRFLGVLRADEQRAGMSGQGDRERCRTRWRSRMCRMRCGSLRAGAGPQ